MCITGFRGKIEHKWRFNGFEITETSYPPHVSIKAHSHYCSMLSIVLSGSFSEQFKNKKIEMSELGLCYKPAREVHSNKFHNYGARCLTIQLSNEWIEKLHNEGFDTEHVLVSSTYLNTSILTRLRNELQIIDKYSETIIQGLIIELFANLMRPAAETEDKTHIPGWLTDIIDYIENSLYDDLSINAIAKNIGIHPVYLINTFRKYYNTTPGKYLRQKKIEHICMELSNGSKSLIDVAYKYNFTDQSHFIKFFKKHTGLTPSKYVSLNRN